MPFVKMTINKKLVASEKKELKKEFGRIITTLHKSEDWLMVGFADGEEDSLFFRGVDELCAIVEISVYGRIDPNDCESMTEEATAVVAKATGASPERIYVNYREVEHWGIAGKNF